MYIKMVRERGFVSGETIARRECQVTSKGDHLFFQFTYLEVYVPIHKFKI